MTLAEQYVKAVIACNDDMDKLEQVNSQYIKADQLTGSLKNSHRSYELYFSDGSWIDKVYVGNERSEFRCYGSRS